MERPHPDYVDIIHFRTHIPHGFVLPLQAPNNGEKSLLQKSSTKCCQVITSLPYVLFLDSHHSNASPFNTKTTRITCCSSLTSIALKSLSSSLSHLLASIGSFVPMKARRSSFLNFSRALVELVAPT